MTPETLLQQLERADVAEVAIQSGRLPCVSVDGKMLPFAQQAVEREALEALLGKAGGAAHVARGGGQWAFRSPIGVVDVSLLVRGEQMVARFKRRAGDAQQAPPRASKRPGPESRASKRPGPESRASKLPGPESRASKRPGAESRASKRPAMAPPADGRAENALRIPQHAPRISDRSPRASERSPRISERPRARASRRAPRMADGLDALLEKARALGASDLHLVAGRPGLLRIAGELVPHGEPLSGSALEQLILPRIPARLVAGFEAEGSCDFALEHEQHGRFRANVSRQRTGLKASLRLLPRQIPTLASLGLPDSIGQATRHHQGLIILTGPTGHGKTTTLAAIVDIINTETSHHVLTVEDPIEFVHPKKRAIMSQREVGTHTRSFANALKASLREDPDVIIVGELRDTETVKMAVAASETGHLVISTMNTQSAAKTIDRLIDLFPPADQPQIRMTLAGGLRLVVSQRLIPNARKDGVVVAAEVLPGSPALWNLIRDSKTYQIPSLQQRGKALGIVRLDDSLAELVKAGLVTKETAIEYADAPEELRVALDAPKVAAAAVAAAAAAPKRPQHGAAAKEAAGALLQRAGALFNRNDR